MLFLTHCPVLLQTEIRKMAIFYVISSLQEMSLVVRDYLSPPKLVLSHLAYACLKSCCRMRNDVP